MKGKDIISAVVGGSFFAVPYLLFSATFPPALLIGCAAFGASELVLSGLEKKDLLKETNLPLYKKVIKAKEQNKEIAKMIPKIELESTKKNLKEINDTVNKIILKIEESPDKGEKLHNFFDYYMPVLLKILNKYDEVENQKLESKEGNSFMKKADKMISDTNEAFKTILSSLFSHDIMDADAEMKVFDMMLKADGIVDNNSIMKGRDNHEK